MAEGKQIPIDIKTTADNSGVEKAKVGVDDLGNALNAAGQKAAEYEAKLRAVAEKEAELENLNKNFQANRPAQGTPENQSYQEAQIALNKELLLLEADIRIGAKDYANYQQEQRAKAKEEEEALHAAKMEAIKQEKAAEKDAVNDKKQLEEAEKLAKIERAVVMEQLGSAVEKSGGVLADKFREAADEVEKFDQEAATAMRNTADNIDEAVNAGSALIAGFAAGGPLGAGIAAASLGVGLLAEGFKNAEVAAIKASASQRKAMEESATATREAAIEAERRADEQKTQEIEDAIRRQNEALEEGLKLIEKQIASARKQRLEKEEILSAEDELALAQIDENKESGKITDKEAEVQRAEVAVGAKKRAEEYRKLEALQQWESAEAQSTIKNKVAAGIEVKAAEAAALANRKKAIAELAAQQVDITKKEKAFNEALQAQRDVKDNLFVDDEVREKLKNATNIAYSDLLKLPGFKPGVNYSNDSAINAEAQAAKNAEIEASRLAEEAKNAADVARKEAADARANADSKKQESVDTVTTVDRKSEIEAQTTAARENADKIRRDAAKKKEQEAADERAARGRLPGMENDLDRTAAGNRDRLLGTDQATKGPKAKELQAIAKQIADADTTEEIRAIADRFKNMSGGTVELIRGLLAVQEKQAKEVENLKERLNKL